MIINHDGGQCGKGRYHEAPCLPPLKAYAHIDYNKMEKQEANKDGAKLVKNSGRGAAKGDAKWRNFLLDYKFNAKSFNLTLKNWKKHRKDAWNDNQSEPMIVVKFEDGTKLAIVDFDYFAERDELAWRYEDLS